MVDIQAFVKKWSLDGESEQQLFDASEETQEIAIRKFSPKVKTDDYNPLFIKFLESLHKPRPGMKTRFSQRTDPQRTDPSDDGQTVDVDAFCDKFNLDRTSRDLFTQLPEWSKRKLQFDFEPRDTTKDVNELFQSFCSSRLKAAEEKLELQGQIEDFLDSHEIDDENRIRFNILPYQIKMGIVDDFIPRDETKDINQLFDSFMKSRLNGNKGDKGKGKGKGIETYTVSRSKEGSSRRDDPYSSYNESRRSKRSSSYGRGKREELGRGRRDYSSYNESGGKSRGKGSMMTTTDFIRQHQLDAENVALVESLHKHPIALAKILSEFEIRDPHADPNVLFHSFWLSRVTSALKNTYHLTERSIKMFKDVPEEKMAGVIKEFEPRDETKDVNELFQSFCRSRRTGGGSSFDRDAGIKRERGYNDSDGAKRSRRHDSGRSPIDTFLRDVKLPSEAKTILYQFDRDTQDTIMKKFNPRSDTKDILNLFRKFTNSFL